MPKKKVAKASKKAATKAVVSRPVSKGKNVKAEATKPAGKTAPKKAKPVKSTKQPAKSLPTEKPSSKAAPQPTAPEVSLGRPLVTQEEKLYMLFHDDYLARQVFEFLRVDTVKELEQYSQRQIVDLMSKPLRMTIERIRQRLATFKRSLKDDEQYAAEFLKGKESIAK